MRRVAYILLSQDSGGRTLTSDGPERARGGGSDGGKKGGEEVGGSRRGKGLGDVGCKGASEWPLESGALTDRWK